MAEDYEPDAEQVEEEFAVWKKNTPILYDLVVSHPLQWPSLTVHWVPSSPQPHPNPSFNLHKLLLGTHTSEGVPNFLMIAAAALPINTSDAVPNLDSDNPATPRIEITQRIAIDGEVNRARCMPQNPNVIGAKTNGSEVYVFDSAKQLGKHQALGCDPDLRLMGHDKEGYGLSWSALKQGYLLSGSHDHKICVWDISASLQENVLDAIHIYEAHETVVEDVSWHMKDETLFGSVGDDCKLIIWDLRTNQAQQSVKAHDRELTIVKQTCLGGKCGQQCAILKGLKLAWDFRFKKIILESDAKNVLDSLKMNRSMKCSLLMLQIQKLLANPWELELCFIHREQNQLSDALTKQGITRSSLLDTCPKQMRMVVEKESLGFNNDQRGRFKKRLGIGG